MLFSKPFHVVAPKTITYRDIKTFDRDTFRNDLRGKLGKITLKSYGMFEKMFLITMLQRKRNLLEPITNHMLQKRRELQLWKGQNLQQDLK